MNPKDFIFKTKNDMLTNINPNYQCEIRPKQKILRQQVRFKTLEALTMMAI
jgi:hypothetical protein